MIVRTNIEDLKPGDWIIFRAGKEYVSGEFIKAERDRYGWDVLYQPRYKEARWHGFPRIAAVDVSR